MLTKITTLKIEQVLVHYLLKNKFLILQGIGTFRLEATLPDTADPEKPIIIPADAITFQYDPKVTEDEGLVDFIVQYTHKIKPLASSDLDSFLSLGRQFLNIGKPFTLPSIGTIDKLNSGELVFVGGQLIAPRMEPQKTKIEDEGAEKHEENLFNDYQKERKQIDSQKIFLVVVLLVLAGLIGWAIWYFGFHNEDVDTVTSTEAIAPVGDSSHIKDSLARAAGNYNLSTKNSTDSFTFKIVVNEFRNKQAAITRFENLKSYNRKVIMYTDDSIIYKIAEPFMRPLSDTTKVLDSLNRYYSADKTKIEY